MRLNLRSITLLALLASAMPLTGPLRAAMTFDGFVPFGKTVDNQTYPVLRLEGRLPVLLTPEGPVPTSKVYINVRKQRVITDLQAKVLNEETRLNEKALILKVRLQTETGLAHPYALLTFPKEGNPDVTLTKSCAIEPMGPGTHSINLRFASNNLPAEGYQWYLFDGQMPVYTGREPNAADASPRERLALAQTLRKMEHPTGTLPPAPFYLPLDALEGALIPDGLKVKLSLTAGGTVASHSFTGDLPPALAEVLNAHMKDWLFLPAMRDGSPVAITIMLPLQGEKGGPQ